MKWKFLVCLFVVVLFNKKTTAQVYMVTYDSYRDVSDSIRNFQTTMDLSRYMRCYPRYWCYKMMFNDSLALCDVFENRQGDLIGQYEKLSMKKRLRYAFFTYCKNNGVYSVSYSPKKKEQLFLLDSVHDTKWILDSTNKEFTLLGYTCHLAYFKRTETDSIFAFYTKQLPGHFGPASFRGLPGTVLAVFQQFYNVSFIASKVEKADYQMKMPANKLLLTRKEYNKLKNE